MSTNSTIAAIAAAKQAHRVIEDGKEALAILEEDPRVAGTEEEWNALLTEAFAFRVSPTVLLSFSSLHTDNQFRPA